MIQAVLWDNDGILVDSETMFYAVTRAAFARLGLDLTKEMWGLWYLGDGKSSREIAAALGSDPGRSGPVLDERNLIYRDAIRGNPPAVRDGVRETLSQLKGAVRLAVVTGCHGDQFDSMHRENGLKDYFDVIVTGDDWSRPKPDPGLYLQALSALDLPPGDCLAVEDSRRGLLAAVRAGVDCVAVPTELTRMQDFSEALAVEDEIPAILKYVK